MTKPNSLLTQPNSPGLNQASARRTPLSDTQYAAGLRIFQNCTAYRDFIVPQLSRSETVLACLPGHLIRRIKRYVAYEPNDVFAEILEGSMGTEEVLPCLNLAAQVHRTSFDLETSTGDEKFDLILFCHSMSDMKPSHASITRALSMLTQHGIVVVFHRDGTLDFGSLVCTQTASFPTGLVCMADIDAVLDDFAAFIAGGSSEDAARAIWRELCRSFGVRRHDQLSFSAPEVMYAFNCHATSLSELTDLVLVVKEDRAIKNREARLQRPAAIARPTDTRQVQQCVQWVLRNEFSLTVIGGGHGGHCLKGNVFAVDMSAFDKVHLTAVEKTEEGREGIGKNLGALVVAEAGSTTGDIIRKTMAAGLTVPLGSRPTVGAGLWLQGGIGHLSRLHGLSCDAIIGTILVSVASGQILCVGHVPEQHIPRGAVRPANEADLLWAVKGAGTNFGIVMSVTFKAYPAPVYSTRNWVVPLADEAEALLQIRKFDTLVARDLDQKCSADACLYCKDHRLHLGVAVIEAYNSNFTRVLLTPAFEADIWGSGSDIKTVDGFGLFETEIYVYGMHGGHAGGKSSAFKRCIFLKNIGDKKIASRLVAAIKAQPSQFCYLHMIQGGGAVGDIAEEATAFGCRDWEYACVITGVWPREEGDDSELARSVKQWVYNVAEDLLPLSCGAYDPSNVLAHACPFPAASKLKLIILVTGEICAGKDHRAYKEQHRLALTAYFEEQVRQRPLLPDEHFLDMVHNAVGVDVLLITGIRDNAPVASFSHLVPECRLIEVNVCASENTRCMRRGSGEDNHDNDVDLTQMNYRPDLIFNNDETGDDAAQMFAESYLLPFLHSDLNLLAEMVREVPNFPRSGIDFRHVLGIAHQAGGLALCTDLLESRFPGDWAKIGAIACCGIGGIAFASALALRVDVPLPTSYISAMLSSSSEEALIEVERDVIPKGRPAVVIDDVLSSGSTLCALLDLLITAGVAAENIDVMVIAEFPVHRGRELLRNRGFGTIRVQSLLVVEGV
ncbi:hypothetical protein EJ02DRAFT_507382 [Clathrospora elynae]|uniref:FAD-binding PCMH-type domain-containing protein n=1 Tax=Clathrospora elynae TaxID=706981 RepID=A0A6A5S483_9PLEO|nr:hypothetical protein EJ02DRAFT_507382 [Clathrospora elynae]